MPRRKPEAPSFEGYLDSASWDRIVGWARFPQEPDRRATIELVANGQVVRTVIADQPRPDLVTAGKGDGQHGFAVTLPKFLFAAPTVHLRAREASTGLDLDNTPVLLLNDEAGLDERTRDFLADRVGQVEAGGDARAIDDQAAFLLRQFDRLMAARTRMHDEHAADLSRWTRLAPETGPDGPVRTLIAGAMQQYGNEALHLSTSDTPEVSIVIPVRDAFRYTHACLRSIAAHRTARPFEVILVDDASGDETVLAPLLLSGVRVVRNASNQGFVGAVTAGVAHARGRLLLLLNNDTEVQPGWLDALCDTLDLDPCIGIVGAKLLFPGGALQECGSIVWRNGDAFNYGGDQDPGRPEYRFLRDADYVSGAAMLVRRDVWDAVGGLSPEYAPGYYEDTDLCFKAREVGFRVVVQTTALVMHHGGVSAGKDVAGTGMKRHQRTNMQRFADRWAHRLRTHAEPDGVRAKAEAERAITRHALFIDDTVPTPDKDAGSNAVLAHMLSVMRLGWHVHFVPSDNMARTHPYTDALERVGIRCHDRPYSNSVEEVLRRHAGLFEVVYLHRLTNARYMRMVRACNPEAQVVYNVADLHHLRLLREAGLSRDPALRRTAQAIQAEELQATADADCTITHSTHEAGLIQAAHPAAHVVVAPWTMRPTPTPVPFADRHGIAFVGSRHGPNADAAEWLVREIMPLVWAQAPEIVLHLLGEHAEDPRLRALPDARVVLAGWVPDLRAALSDRRLTVAPLRYGAGLKGKLLDSMAAGLPCVLTPCAAEGADLPGPLLDLVADEPACLAALVVALHADESRNQAAAEASLQHIRSTCSEAAIDVRLGLAVRRAPPARPPGVSDVIPLAPIRAVRASRKV